MPVGSGGGVNSLGMKGRKNRETVIVVNVNCAAT